MNKQKSMLLEVIALVSFIALFCILVWNLKFYPTQANKTTNPAIDSYTPENTSVTLKDEKLEKGRLLFHSYCNSCHYPLSNGLGPALSGAKGRWERAGSFKGKTGDEWLKMWVRNWKDVVAAGYPYGVEMAKSRENEMNMFINLKDYQIDLILNYVDSVKPSARVN